MYDSVYIAIAIIQECAKYCMHGYSQSQNQNLPQHGLFSVSQMFPCVILEVIFMRFEDEHNKLHVVTTYWRCCTQRFTAWQNLIQLRNGMTRGETGLMSGCYVWPSLPKKFSLLEHQGAQLILYFTCIFKMYFWSCFTTLAVACKVPARPGQPGKTMTGKGIVKGIVNV